MMEPDLIDQKFRDPNSILPLEVMQFLSPVSAYFNRLWFQVSLLACGIWLLFDLYHSASRYSTYGQARYRTVKIDVKFPNENSSEFFLGTPYVRGEFHILRAGCRIASENFTLKADSKLTPFMSIPFLDPVIMDGFSLNLSNVSSSLRFILYGSTGPNEEWIRFGQTTEMRKLSSEIRFVESDHSNMYAAGYALFDLRAPWPLFAESSVSYIVLACSSLSITVLGIRQHHSEAKLVMTITTVLLAIVELIAGGGYCILGMWRESFPPLLDTVIYLLLFASIRTSEKYFFDSLFWLSIVGLIGAYIQDCVLFNDCSHLQHSPPAKFIVFAVFGSTFLVLRGLALLHAVRAVSSDLVRYNALWCEVQGSREEARALRDLAAAASQLADACDPARARHYNRRRPLPPDASKAAAVGAALADTASAPAPHPPASPPLGPPADSPSDPGQARFRINRTGSCRNEAVVDSDSSTLPGTWDPARPVLSLDQLYTQALGASTALLTHAADWAASSGGTLDLEPPCDGPYPPAPEAADPVGQLGHGRGAGLVPPSALELIRRRAMKAPARAVEKALTCYGGDLSRLVDICRCRVRCDSVRQVLCCLQLVGADQSRGVRVVRVKNSMDDRASAWCTAGFRGIVLNLLFVNEDTKRLGIENHVCELQLILESFRTMVYPDDSLLYTDFWADLTIDTSHARFLKFRAVRDQARKWLWVQTRSSTGIICPAPVQKCSSDMQRNLEVVMNRTSVTTSACVCHDKCQLANGSSAEFCFEATRLGEGCSGFPGEIVPVADIHPKSIWSIDNSIAENDMKVPIEVFVLSSLNPGGVLDQQAALVVNAVEDSSSGTIWFTSTPLAAGASRLVFQLAYVGFIIFFVIHSVSFYEINRTNGIFEAYTVTFDVLETSISGNSLMKAPIANFGLLLDGCDVVGGNCSFLDSGSVLCKYGQAVLANGYHFAPSETMEKVSIFPRRWELRVQAVANRSWIPISASGWQYGSYGETIPLPQLEYELPIIHGERVAIDNRRIWPAMVMVAWGGIEWTLALAFCIVMARLGLLRWVRICFVCCSSFDVIVTLVCSVGFLVMGFKRNSIENFLILISQLTFAVGIIWFEPKIVYVFMVYGLQFWAIISIKDLLIYRRSLNETVVDLFSSFGTVIFVFGIGVLFFRRRAIVRARQLVHHDMYNYNAAWARVKSAENASSKLVELETLVSSILNENVCETPRQYNCTAVTAPSSEASVLHHSMNCPIKSLDQLFVQARCMHPLLLNKVKLWAVKTNGFFQVEVIGSEPCTKKEYVALVAVEANSHVQPKFAKIKSVARAVEKLVRSYGQDVSQLVDVCRQSIVFETIDDLISCLRSMTEDKEVTILRIKNRLACGYDSTCSAGYRDVSINLRFETAAAVDLGVHLHVCEVQLILMPFAEIKSDEGHKRYVIFRNLRGE